MVFNASLFVGVKLDVDGTAELDLSGVERQQHFLVISMLMVI